MVKVTRGKRILALGLALCLSVGIFAGCGSSATSDTGTSSQSEQTTADSTVAQEPVSLQFWTISLQPTFTDFFNDLIAKYQTEHKNVTVKWSDIPYDAIQNKLITSAAGGNAPDVVNLNTELALTLAGKDILVNLEKEATEEQKSVYIKTLFDSTKTSKGTYAFPWYGAPSVMIYNKDLFSKAGIANPPKTFDEMLSVAKQMKEKTGAYLYIPDEFRKILWLEGIPLINEDKTKAAFNTPEALELLTKYKDAVDQKLIQKDDWGQWDKMLQQFNTGKLAMLNSGAQSIVRVKDEAPNIYKNIEITEPMVGKAGVVSNSIMNLVVTELSKHHTEAIDFAAYITNDENQLAFSKAVAIFPSTIKASQDSFFKSDTSTPETKAVSIAAEMLPKSADMSLAIVNELDIYGILKKAQQAVTISNEDPKKALDNAEKKVNELLEAAK